MTTLVTIRTPKSVKEDNFPEYSLPFKAFKEILLPKMQADDTAAQRLIRFATDNSDEAQAICDVEIIVNSCFATTSPQERERFYGIIENFMQQRSSSGSKSAKPQEYERGDLHHSTRRAAIAGLFTLAAGGLTALASMPYVAVNIRQKENPEVALSTQILGAGYSIEGKKLLTTCRLLNEAMITLEHILSRCANQENVREVVDSEINRTHKHIVESWGFKESSTGRCRF